MTELFIGPFLVPNHRKGIVCPEVEEAGYTLELATPQRAYHVPLYRRVQAWRKETGEIDFEDYLFHQKDQPLDLYCLPFHMVSTPLGCFLPFYTLLIDLFASPKQFDKFTQFMEEFRRCLPLNGGKENNLQNGRQYLCKEVAELGFTVGSFFSYSRSLSVELDWMFPQDRQNPDCNVRLGLGYVEFRPQPDRTLNQGKWGTPLDGSLPAFLMRMLRSRFKKAPSELLSPEGREAALKAFTWPLLSRMTKDQARQARVEFARKHADLMDRPRELAILMRKAQLYSETSATSGILKSLPAIIAEARKKIGS